MNLDGRVRGEKNFFLLLLFVFLTYLTHSKRELHLHCSP